MSVEDFDLKKIHRKCVHIMNCILGKKINKRAVIFFKKHCITSYRSKTLFRTTLGIANIVLHWIVGKHFRGSHYRLHITTIAGIQSSSGSSS